MKLSGNDFIDLLYCCEDDSTVVQMRETLNVDRPALGKKYKEDGYISIEVKPHAVELFFSDISNFPETIGESQSCDIVFSGIFFYRQSTIPFPFGLKVGDSLEDVIKKIGGDYKYRNKRFPRTTWILQRNDGKNILLYVTFDGNEYRKLVSAKLATYDDNIDHLKNHQLINI